VCGFVQRCWAFAANELALQVLPCRNSQGIEAGCAGDVKP